MNNFNWSKLLIYIGIIFIFSGIILNYTKISFGWFGNLPGDLKIEKENFKLFFPITSMLIITVIINFIIYLMKILIRH